MRQLLIATTNPGKRDEMRAILEAVSPPLDAALVTPEQLGLKIEVKESGSSYVENAALKAHAFCRAANLITLADDSGLEVAALAGMPGIYSAHYTPAGNEPGAPGADGDARRRTYLLQQLQPHPRPWRARFCCTVAIALPDGTLYCSEGEVAGEIIPQERGSGGFGYDPIFLLSELGLTMAELESEVKNRLSHRAAALQAALPQLRRLFAP